MTVAERHQRVVRLELRARRVVNHLAPGFYRSSFRGNGTEFQEIREYVAGDDVRSIDWNVTARHNKPFVKRFSEERGQTLMILLDGSASTDFGSGPTRKRDTIAEVAAVLASAAIQNQDKVGLIAFGSDVEVFIPPSNNSQQARRLIREVLSFEPTKRGTDIGRALRFLDRVVPRRTFAFLISDFFDNGFEVQCKASAERHELIAVSVLDELETGFPDCGLVTLGDPETDRTLVIDSSDPAVRTAIGQQFQLRQSRLSQLLLEAGVDHLRLPAVGDILPPLVRFLRNHAKRA